MHGIGPSIESGRKGEEMAQFKNAMEIFKLLNKSNCRECKEATCLAFAAAVFQGRRKLNECPHLDQSILEKEHLPGVHYDK